MRILVTRPDREARRTAVRIEAMGHEALCAPVLTIRPTALPAPSGPYAAVLVTSVNGAARLDALPGWRDSVVYAVGPRTAEAIRALGEPKELRVAQGDAGSMVPLISGALAPGARLVHVTGVDHKAEPDASLRAAGFAVLTWTAYEAVAATALPQPIATALQQERLDAALHYSRRSVATLLGLVPQGPLLDGFRRLRHFCLSQDVAEPLRAAQAPVITVAPTPSEAALLGLLTDTGKPPAP